MNYLKIYDSIISKRKQEIPEGYTETHHVIPVCMGGTDSGENLVKLTAREHFIVHWLLAKIYNGSELGYKLSSAFNMMSLDSNHKERYKCTSKKYEIARKLFSLNHPCKNDNVKNKISETLKEKNRLKRCGEKQKQELKKEAIQIRKIAKDLEKIEKNKKLEELKSIRLKNKEKRKIEQEKRKIEQESKKLLNESKTEIRKCQCGCGVNFEVLVQSSRKFAQRKCTISQEMREKLSNLKKTQLSLMTPEELQERSKKSFGSCDQESRGKNISKSKKGVQTDQSIKNIETYGKMSHDEFCAHIKGRNKNVINRMIKFRKQYNGNND